MSIKGQTITLKGFVRDSLQNPLPYVSLIAKPVVSGESMKFTITDDKGRYNLELYKDVNYVISTSHLGFKTVEFRFVSSENYQKEILLIEDINQLNEVVIELPLIVKKDTIIYNTNKFVSGEERKLKDILKKLPGIEVDENGNVTSNGKIITHMLVEGKKFFGGDSKLAVENIPANAVDKVVVVDDYNEVSFLKGLTDSENLAMNIELKDNKKNFVFGDLETGKSNRGYYKSHSNLFYYNPRFNVNFIGNLNNAGERVFTFKDYLNFKGGPSSVFNQRDYTVDKSNFSQFLEPLDVVKSVVKMGALNITRTVSDKINISSYLIFSRLNFNSNEETINQYLIPSANYREDISDLENVRNILGIAKLNLEYGPRNNERWLLKMLIKKSNNFNERSILSKISNDSDLFINSIDDGNDYINGNLEWHKKASKKHTFSFNLNYTYNNKNIDSYWETKQAILQGLIPLLPVQSYKLTSKKQEKKRSGNILFKHYWVLNKFSQFYTTFGNTYKENEFYTNDSQQLDEGITNDFGTAGFNNNLNFKLNDLYLGVSYKFGFGIFKFRQSLFAHKYTWKINQENLIRKRKLIFLPDFTTNIRLSQSENIKLHYILKNSISDISKFSNRFYLQSYNLVYKGNEQLENELKHFSRISYSKANLFRGLFLLGEISYSKKVRAVSNFIQTSGIDNYLSPIMMDNFSESLRGNFIINKTKKNIKYNFRAKVATSKYLEVINSDFIVNKSTSSLFKFSIKSLNKKFPIIEVGLEQRFGNYISNSIPFKFNVKESFVTFDYDFFKKIIVSIDYTHHIYQNKSLGIIDSYDLANATLIYGKKNSLWKFKVSGQNLLDVKFKKKNSFNSHIISDTRTYTLPRIVMLSIIYKI